MALGLTVPYMAVRETLTKQETMNAKQNFIGVPTHGSPHGRRLKSETHGAGQGANIITITISCCGASPYVVDGSLTVHPA